MDPSNTDHININKNANILQIGPYILIPLMRCNTRIMVIVSLGASSIFHISQFTMSPIFSPFS